jgi:cytochrome c5
MADSHAEMTPTTPQEFVIAVLAGLIAPLLAIILIVALVLGIQKEHKPDTSSEAAQKATLARIQPFAQLAALDASVPKVEKSGKDVYDATCVACHGSGALGAPRFENKADWGARISQGYDLLVKHAIEGIRLMPPRGGAAALTDTEVARAVAYMANSAGAGFKEPDAAAVPEATPAAEATTAPEAAAAPAAAAAPKPDPAKGKQVYQTTCALCHAASIAGAPKPGDMAAWEPRVAQGYATLYSHAINGIRGMPPKGGNPSLSEADIANAVGYMFSESGGKL